MTHHFGKVNIAIDTLREHLSQICGGNNVYGGERLGHYGSDHTLDLRFPFDILVKPGSAGEISRILKFCNKYKIPVTPRGGGSGVTGGALPVNKGIILSTERLNRIIEINRTDSMAVAEAGVICEDLCDAVERAGLYFPVAPSSKSFSFIGGNVAENAGSMNSCRYGTTRDYVVNLEVVLPSGEIIWTGANVTKNSTGLNLTQLFVGSEGILGIITKVVYRLIAKPKHNAMLLAGFRDLKTACEVIAALKKSIHVPSMVEIVDQRAISLASAYLNEPLPLVEPGIRAHLLIGFEEDLSEALDAAMTAIAAVIEAHHPLGDILVASTAAERSLLCKLRHAIGPAMTIEGRKYRDIDACVPLSKLYEYVMRVNAIAEGYGISLACFGHAMDGNIHTMLIFDKENQITQEAVVQCIEEIYRSAVSLGGVLSGEHGIGWLQKDFLRIQFSDTIISLMKAIKKTFDPNGILNPGKVVDISLDR